jgi:tetratricopeptide (TPR) repeat protein
VRFRGAPEADASKPGTGLRWDAELTDEAEPGRKLEPGDRVEGTSYRIVRWLGDGGMGVVYEAEHVELGRRVALKVMHRGIASSKTAAELFRGEARRASQLGSENIVAVYDFAESARGELMFTMELLEGRTLDEEIGREVLSPSKAIGILRQLCRGLAAAHTAGVVHRDVKPENVVLVPVEGGRDMVKILDFGISTMLGSREGTHAVGSPHYMAPEVFMGSQPDARIDVYGVGCTAYEMLTGQPPFVFEEIAAVLAAHFEEEPVPPSLRRPDLQIPEALDAVVLRCLAKDASHRYQDMADLEAALCEAQAAAGLFTAWDDLPLPEVESERRARLIEQMPEPEVEAPASGQRWLAAVGAVALAAVAGMGGFVLGASRGADVAQRQVNEDPVLALARKAEAAAARGGYMVARNGDEDTELADTYLKQLEAMKGPEGSRARELAASLRSDMAGALVQTGDELWQDESARPIAVRFYGEALMFGASDKLTYTRAMDTRYQGGASPSDAQAMDAGEFVDDDAGEGETGEELDAEAPKSETPLDPKARRAAWLARVEKRKKDQAKARSLAMEGIAAKRRGDRAEAEKLLRRALRYDYRNAPALSALSEILFLRGDASTAVVYALRMVKLRPRNTSYRIRLGDIYAKMGRKERALQEYRVAKELGDKSAAASIRALNKRGG